MGSTLGKVFGEDGVEVSAQSRTARSREGFVGEPCGSALLRALDVPKTDEVSGFWHGCGWQQTQIMDETCAWQERGFLEADRGLLWLCSPLLPC